MKSCTFSRALNAVMKGDRISRRAWDEKAYVRHCVAGDRVNVEFLAICYHPDHPVNPMKTIPWTPTQDDLMAKDWVIRKM